MRAGQDFVKAVFNERGMGDGGWVTKATVWPLPDTGIHGPVVEPTALLSDGVAPASVSYHNST